MKKHTVFLSFLKTGRLNVLEIGASSKEVEKVLGKPEDYAYGKDPNSLHSYYDRVLQIGYNKGIVSWYGIYFNYIKKDTDELSIFNCRFPVKKNTTSKEIKHFLEQEKIVFEVNRQLSSDETLALNIGSNIIFFFYNDKIDKLQVTDFR
nr:hypothetical protein [uncultured Desulfobacter sp.]